MATIQVVAVEIFEVEKDEDGNPFETPQKALEYFKEDPSWFDWSEREIHSIQIVEE